MIKLIDMKFKQNTYNMLIFIISKNWVIKFYSTKDMANLKISNNIKFFVWSFLYEVFCMNSFLYEVLCMNSFLYEVLCMNSFLYEVLCMNSFLYEGSFSAPPIAISMNFIYFVYKWKIIFDICKMHVIILF